MPPSHPDALGPTEGNAAIHVDGAQARTITRGIEQRGQLAHLLVHDLISSHLSVSEGLIPPDVLSETPGWSASLNCPLPESSPGVLLTSLELVRNADRSWTVLADRTSLPHGLGILASAPWGEDSPFTTFSQAVRTELDLRGGSPALLFEPSATSPDENLTPDLIVRDAEEAASAFGLDLLTPADLRVRQGRLERVDGEQAPDLLVRFVPSSALDPLEPLGRPGTGVPGLGALIRKLHLALANPPAAAVLANPALATFLPRLARYFLTEDLILPPVTTYWCGERSMCSHVIAHASRLVIRSVSTREIFDGRTLGIRQIADLCAQISDEPWDWVGQEPVEPDAVQLPDGNITPVMVRGYAVGGERWHALAGGLSFVGELDDRNRPLTHVLLTEGTA